eukprot:TRINITY_DN6524_c0_g1_i1.p1 TRINITY_DN6524_c0_g1~~TRINITY_DN6524_c0_g1_i1.p1  ORF type:complete len:686 (-),score=131.63 TRINITY_DN6524_c0_g1_i1:232-2289(-)
MQVLLCRRGCPTTILPATRAYTRRRMMQQRAATFASSSTPALDAATLRHDYNRPADPQDPLPLFGAAAGEPESEGKKRLLVPMRSMFSNFQVLNELLRQEIKPTKPYEYHDKEHIDYITNLLENIQINPREWQQFAHFSAGKYTRNLVGYNDKFIMLMLCWSKGQQSPIHDHTGCSGWIKMLDGELLETRYEWPAEEDGRMEVKETIRIKTGTVSYINDTRGVHRISNPHPEKPAISLHVYSPVVTDCQIFQPTTGKPTWVSLVGANAPDMPASRQSSGALASVDNQEANLTLREFTQRIRELSLERQDLFRSEVPDEEVVQTVNDALERLELSKIEWEQYCAAPMFDEKAPSRNLVHLDENFSLIISCWEKGQASPVHTVGSNRVSWIKILNGQLSLEFDNKAGEEQREGRTIKTHEWTSFRSESRPRFFRWRNPSDNNVAVAVHLYTPPVKEVRYVDEVGQRRSSPVVSAMPPTGDSTLDDSFMSPFRMRGSWFTNMSSLTAVLDGIFAKADLSNHARTMALTNALKTANINPMEYRQHASWDERHFTRVLLHHDQQYMLVLACWEPGQFSEPHDHGGSSNWISVLEGKLEEQVFDQPKLRSTDAVSTLGELILTRSSELPEESVTYVGPSTIHSCLNSADSRTYTLHLYAPPYLQARAFGEGGEVINVDIACPRASSSSPSS